MPELVHQWRTKRGILDADSISAAIEEPLGMVGHGLSNPQVAFRITKGHKPFDPSIRTFKWLVPIK